jgi:hypothetical protein
MLGIIDGQGNEIAPAIYESISASTDDSGIILVCKDGKYGYLSKEGKALTKTVYDRASVFDGAGIAWKGNVWYIPSLTETKKKCLGFWPHKASIQGIFQTMQAITSTLIIWTTLCPTLTFSSLLSAA